MPTIEDLRRAVWATQDELDHQKAVLAGLTREGDSPAEFAELQRRVQVADAACRAAVRALAAAVNAAART